MQLGKQTFLLGAVITEPYDYPNWTNRISFGELIDLARSLRLGRFETLELDSVSLTNFKRSNKKSQVYKVLSASQIFGAPSR